MVDFEKELDWLKRLIDLRFNLYFETGRKPAFPSVEKLLPPKLGNSAYAKFVKEHQLKASERLLLALCVAVHLQPELLDVFFTKNKTYERHFSEFGGYVPNNYSSFLPTGTTFLFLWAGKNIKAKLEAMALLDPQHEFYKDRVLELIPPSDARPQQFGAIRLGEEYLSKWFLKKTFQPEFGFDFPAQRIDSELKWDTDLILPDATKNQLEEIRLWAEHGEAFLKNSDLKKKIRPGYRSLFYGPPGTGKTMTAKLLGKLTGRDVYRIDLSMVISKYIGETEKNLAKVFNTAIHKNWILFFDEADALFGKRTMVQSSHDRYANQEISYLLQRLENFTGITILATNLRGNIDEAFTRRFESIIYFPLPGAEQRLLLWENAFPKRKGPKRAKDIDFREIAEKYELTGGAIMNVLRYTSLKAIGNGNVITSSILLEGIQREYWKEGRSV